MSDSKNRVLDKPTQDLLAGFAQADPKPISDMTPEEGRAFSAYLSSLSGPPPDIESTEDKTVDYADGSFTIRILKPEGTVKSVIVYYHGGGWVIGDIDTYDTFAKIFAIETQSIVVLVNYRKAPKYRYPIAAKDSYAALEWVYKKLENIAGQKLPLIVAGDSAGGNLSAVVAQKARDNNGPTIDLQVLVYPVTDSDLETISYNDPANQLLLTKDAMIWFWDHYLPDVTARQNIDVSPLRAEDFSDLPPTILLTAGFDPLRDEGKAYAGALIKAGVPVVYKEYEDQTHNFFVMPRTLPRSEEAIRFVAGSIDLLLSNR